MPQRLTRPGIAAKLYGVCLLSLAATAALIAASVHFAARTGDTAQRFYEDGLLAQGNNLWVPREGTSGDSLQYDNMANVMEVERGGWSFGAQFGDVTPGHPYEGDSAPAGFPQIHTVSPAAYDHRYGTEYRKKQGISANGPGWHADVTPLINPP